MVTLTEHKSVILPLLGKWLFCAFGLSLSPEKYQNMRLMKNRQTKKIGRKKANIYIGLFRRKKSEEATEAGIESCCSCTLSRSFHHRRSHVQPTCCIFILQKNTILV